MKIVLLSDLHLTSKGELVRGNFDVNAQFEDILQYLKKEEFDFIVILGDTCCQEPETEIYLWFLEEIEALNKPFEIISGNHDSSTLLMKLFKKPTVDPSKEKLFFSNYLSDQYCLFLDSSDGYVTGEQKTWLERELEENTEDLIIFMHHPPCYAGVPFMDGKYPLENREEILTLFNSQDYKIDVFTGHYHVDKELQFGNCHIHICPSPYFILDQNEKEFVIEKQVPCFKILDLGNNRIELETIELANA